MKINNKLFLIFFSYSLLLVIALVLLMQWSLGKGMVEYVNTKESNDLRPLIVELANAYKANNDWSLLKGKNKKFSDLVYGKLKDTDLMPPLDLLRPRPPLRKDHFMQPRGDFKRQFQDQNIYVLLNKKQNVIVGHVRKEIEYEKKPIKVNHKVVGFFAFPLRKQLSDGYELAFVQQQKSYFWIIAFIAMSFVSLINFPLARHVVGPIKLVMEGMHKLTLGHYQQKIALNRKDELGELGADFNELALTLDINDKARRRWLANISHELRTPVSILRGELEAMLDGVRPLTLNGINSANDEVKHLQCLIDDLHQLTSSDIGGMYYNKSEHDLSKWLKSEVTKYSCYLANANITLESQLNSTPLSVFIDPIRLCQLFDNLMNNCVKYSRANKVKISTTVDKSTEHPIVKITVEDNGVGVESQHLKNLFEYLYRVDDARNRQNGGSGLGLSICAHIVTGHQGTIAAEHSPLGGLAIVIELPLLALRS